MTQLAWLVGSFKSLAVWCFFHVPTVGTKPSPGFLDGLTGFHYKARHRISCKATQSRSSVVTVVRRAWIGGCRAYRTSVYWNRRTRTSLSLLPKCSPLSTSPSILAHLPWSPLLRLADIKTQEQTGMQWSSCPKPGFLSSESVNREFRGPLLPEEMTVGPLFG